jgi:NAD(P)-dependent dehydrogenase (short-subunit alcohol dehydrogenase family)
MVDFSGSHVVVTGGTGALGRAVIGALRAANAVCHVPNLIAAELDGFPYASDPGVQIARGIDLADEAAVKRFYGALPPLWASIHLAGGFAMAPIGETSAEDFKLVLGLFWVCLLFCLC